MPQISVIVPVYKVEPYLHRCVDSILAQNFTDFELILVDDGSPDNCPAICDEYALKDSRVHVIHQENGGLSAARNAGIDWAFDNSNSQWLTFIDSDDFVYFEYLDRLYQAANFLKTKISICKIAANDSTIMEEDLFPLKYLTEDAYYSEILGISMESSCGKLYQKILWQNIRFPQQKLHEDRFTTHKVLFQSPDMAIIRAPLYKYCFNPNSITHLPWNPKRLDDIEALEQQCEYFKEINALHAWKKYVISSMWSITWMIHGIDKKDNPTSEDLRYKKELIKKLRKSIKNCKKIANINIDNYCYAYEIAYPRLIRLYWYGSAILRNLKLMK